jgi:hypothetical protein
MATRRAWRITLFAARALQPQHSLSSTGLVHTTSADKPIPFGALLPSSVRSLVFLLLPNLFKSLRVEIRA